MLYKFFTNFQSKKLSLKQEVLAVSLYVKFGYKIAAAAVEAATNIKLYIGDLQ